MDVLLVFLKYPTPGAVKTRLARTIGPSRAAELYASWIRRVLTEMQPVRRGRRIIACYDGAPVSDFAAWHHLADLWWPQSAGDLGRRLEAAFADARRFAERVAAIGSDCLELDAAMVLRGFSLLKEHAAVFGPTEDGGYYLVGTSRPLDGFFDGLPWSTPRLLDAHVARCREHHWSAALLPTLADIDTWEDWVRYRQLRRSTAPIAPGIASAEQALSQRETQC